MWIPSSLEDVERAIEIGLTETEQLEAKRELPSSRKIARSVAAMANYGGLLLYGVEHDGTEQKRLHAVRPIDDLALAEERVANIITSSVHNPPRYRALQLERDAGSGVLAVHVPASPLAPHMVVSGGDHRYYGRVGTTTPPLSPEQVRSLFERRQVFGQQREGMLEGEEGWHLRSGSSEGTLVVVVSPLLSDPGLVDRASGALPPGNYLTRELTSVVRNLPLDTDGGGVAPLNGLVQGGWRVLTGGHRTGRSNGDVSIDEIEVRHDGTLVLRLAELTYTQQFFAGGYEYEVIDDSRLAVSVVFALMAGAAVLEGGQYDGPVAAAVDLRGIGGRTSAQLNWRRRTRGGTAEPTPLAESRYRHDLETDLALLRARPAETARDLLARLFDSLAQGPYPDDCDPLAMTAD